MGGKNSALAPEYIEDLTELTFLNKHEIQQ